MELLMNDVLLELLLISVTFSFFLMALIQKLKKSHLFRFKWQIWLLNLLSAFLLGIPFTMTFYNRSFEEAIWVALFGFIGAPSLYETLKKQNLISYKPASSNCSSKDENVVCIAKENEIQRKDLL